MMRHDDLRLFDRYMITIKVSTVFQIQNTSIFPMKFYSSTVFLTITVSEGISAFISAPKYASKSVHGCRIDALGLKRAQTVTTYKYRDTCVASSSDEYSDFDNFDDEDDDDDDDDDDDYIDLDDSAVANFKAMMGIDETEEDKDSEDEDEDEYPEIIEDSGTSFSSVDELISFATTKSLSDVPSTDWATPVDISALGSGICLIANPAKFCDDFGAEKPPSLSLLSKFGLTLPPPPELGPDRRADLLPVLLLLDKSPLKGKTI